VVIRLDDGSEGAGGWAIRLDRAHAGLLQEVGQLGAGIEHASFHRGGRHADDARDLVDRLRAAGTWGREWRGAREMCICPAGRSALSGQL
jgi:hypothetical protein